ncbi:MAG: aromatic acid decarboxylase [Deltaproteobacteria bacterium RIFOXYD12_FULL_57_12]|nr:MAG: aromatic acid decarboxylase [Deltaproteobacteria bacterium RIFOXYD12_FULL_57_12]
MKRIILAITGASGSLYAREFLRLMQELDVEVHGIVSAAGREVMGFELACTPEDLADLVHAWYPVSDFTAAMASGSSRFDAMVVLPCSMGSLAAIANGISANLIHRAADVMLKEQRPLLLAVRETPLNRTHLRNMLKVQEAGALICPPMPAFYHRPRSLEEMARFFACRLGDLLGLDVPAVNRWAGGI